MANLKTQAEELGIDVDNRWSDATLQSKIDEAKAKQSADDVGNQAGDNRPAVDTSQAKIIPNIGQPRAQTTEEIRQEVEQYDPDASQAGPYPRDPNEANKEAIAVSERQKDAPEFNTDDIKGTSVNGEGKKDTVTVRLLYDWWDGSGVRHPLNSEVEMAINDARNLVEQKKAERIDNW
jgi:hypothetical protein